MSTPGTAVSIASICSRATAFSLVADLQYAEERFLRDLDRADRFHPLLSLLLLLQLRFVIAAELVVERGISLGARLELVEEIHEDLGERQLIAQDHARGARVLHILEGATAVVAQLHAAAHELGRRDDRRLNVR